MLKMTSSVVLSLTLSSFAQQQLPPAPSQAAPAAQEAPSAKGCLAVKDAGSHAFRNIMLGGIAGALVSKKQYEVVDVVDYPAKIGQKFHGDDLQILQTSGIRIVILDKKYAPEDLHGACR
jgi:hypothetical protein